MNEPIYKRSQSTMFSEVGEDVVALHVERGFCYGMENVTSTVWKLLDRPQGLDSLCAELVDRFDVSPEACRSEVGRLLDQLRDEGLVDVIAQD
ncbi:MAG: PqqD family protein [Sphingomicrobium sp.]